MAKWRAIPLHHQNRSTDQWIAMIELRERQILIHSYLYAIDRAIVPDAVFNRWCADLLAFMLKRTTEFKQSEYYTVFKNFDGHADSYRTGNMPDIIEAAHQLIDVGRVA